MKYLLTIVVLLFACSNPADIQPVTEYSISYGGDCVINTWMHKEYFNPETGSTQESNFHGTHFESAPMIAHSGQTLWITITSEQDVTAYIRVDGEIVAESATGDSVYVEWRLL